MTISEWQKLYREKLEPLYGDREARSITRLVFEKILAVNATQLSFDRFRIVTVAQQEQLEAILSRLLTAEPVQYVLGEADFCGFTFKVNSQVLIPRSETEELVHWILSDLKERKADSEIRMIDIGTGSGCIPIALSVKYPQAKVEGIDISNEALEVAVANNLLHQTAVQFRYADILKEHLPANAYDIIVSNPPYITESEKDTLADNVLNHEPHLALFAPQDGLVFYRRIAANAFVALQSGGAIYFEIHAEKGEEVKAILQQAGFNKIELRKDMNGNDRMVKASK